MKMNTIPRVFGLQVWLKQLKSRAVNCSAFMLSVLLVTSEALNRLQQPVMDLLQVYFVYQ